MTFFRQVQWLHLTGEVDKSVRFHVKLSTHQNSSKSVNFSQSCSKNKKVDVFLGTQSIYLASGVSDISSYGHFPYRTFPLPGISPTGLFPYCVFDAPGQLPSCNKRHVGHFPYCGQIKLN